MRALGMTFLGLCVTALLAGALYLSSAQTPAEVAHVYSVAIALSFVPALLFGAGLFCIARPRGKR